MLERAYFGLCLALGWLLQSVKYSKARVVDQHGESMVRKHRVFYAPLLVWLSGPLLRILDSGVVVLPQRAWEERERRIYSTLYGTSVRTDADGAVVLPYLAGDTLASLLEDLGLHESVRNAAIERAVMALAEFHRLGFTHGDAIAANVLVDVEARVAHWFDFETVHDTSRPVDWRRADDVRTLLVTCLVRTRPERFPETLQLILDAYEDLSDEQVTRLMAPNFTSIFRRSLTFHLAQAVLSFQRFQEVARLLRSRLGEGDESGRV